MTPQFASRSIHGFIQMLDDVKPIQQDLRLIACSPTSLPYAAHMSMHITGEYTVSVKMQGFKSQTTTGVQVEYQQKARVKVQFDLGTAAERIEVVDLRTDERFARATIEHTRVRELPIVNRNFASLVVLTPRVQFGRGWPESSFDCRILPPRMVHSQVLPAALELVKLQLHESG